MNSNHKTKSVIGKLFARLQHGFFLESAECLQKSNKAQIQSTWLQNLWANEKNAAPLFHANEQWLNFSFTNN